MFPSAFYLCPEALIVGESPDHLSNHLASPAGGPVKGEAALRLQGGHGFPGERFADTVKTPPGGHRNMRTVHVVLLAAVAFLPGHASMAKVSANGDKGRQNLMMAVILISAAAAWRPGDAGRSGNPAPRAHRTVFGQFHRAATASAGYHPHKAVRGVARWWLAGGLPPGCQRAPPILAPLPALKAGDAVMLFPAPEQQIAAAADPTKPAQDDRAAQFVRHGSMVISPFGGLRA